MVVSRDRSPKNRQESPETGGDQDAPASPAVDKTYEIIQTAARIFCERGFHATSINEIAEAVQLTKAGLYYYIKGKRDLLYRIMDQAMISIERRVLDEAQRESEPTDRLRAIVHSHALLVTQRGSAPFAILVDELGGLEPEQRAAIAARQRRYVRFIRGTLQDLAAADRLRPGVDALVATYSLLGMVLWTSRWFRQDGELSSQHVAEQLADMALASVLRSSSGDDR